MDEWASKRDVIQRYNSTAHIYTRRYAEEQRAKIEAAFKRIRIEEPSLILDIGCGTGLLFEYVTDGVETAVGLDISKKNLLRAKRRVKNMGHLHLILADADNIPTKGKIFSHIFAITLLQNMPKPDKTLDEIKRTSKKDALLIITALKKKFSLELFKSLLKTNKLRIAALANKDLKCHVAVCIKESSSGS